MEIKRGGVYWIDLDPTQGSEIKKTRPCVVFGIDPINQARKTVVVIPLSTSGTVRPPLVIGVNCKEKKASVVIDQIRAVDKSRFKDKFCDLTSEEMREIEEAAKIIFGL